jgi:hypothetical protein
MRAAMGGPSMSNITYHEPEQKPAEAQGMKRTNSTAHISSVAWDMTKQDWLRPVSRLL